jgi:two-component system, cell cycle response regulator
MAYLLSASGHDVIEAHEGSEGLRKARAEKPELVLLDIHMPQMDGYEVARRLRADPQRTRIPVVAVTALAMVGDRERILASGFDGYIAKPIEPELFLSQVNGFLSGTAKRAAIAPVPAPATPTSAAISPKKHALVLFVDNTQTNIDLVRSILEPSGFEVAAAMSAEEGFDLARRVKPDLILSDVHMPREDGYGFMRRVQNDPALRRIPFVFLSASVWSAREKVQALESGATRFLSRPIEPQSLLEEIEGCLRKVSKT